MNAAYGGHCIWSLCSETGPDGLARHLLEDYQRGAAVMLIADECHHYSSPENSRIFDFISHISPGSSSRYYALGLSATPQTPGFDEKLVPALGVQIYKYGFAEALNANIISSFSIFNLKLRFTPDEEQEYLEMSEQLSRVLDALMRRCPYLNGLSSQRFFACLEEMAREADGSALSGLSRAVLTLAHQRKDVVYKARARISCVQNLLQRIPASAKVIIFNERIEMAEAIYARLQRLYPGQVGRYHSEMDERSKKHVLRRYSYSEIRILVTCRALDEGLNVPATNVGIIACSTSSSRQRIQRLGRILRRSGENSHACLYYLYIGSSNEEQELMVDISQELVGLIPVLDLEYDHESQSFLHPSYQPLAERVLAYARRKAWDAEIIGELERNLERGKLGCEWWLSQQECLQRIQTARSRADRNYWISMRLLAQASRQGLPDG
ncbi:MAG: helicase-related protein [Syntrophomonas sp.]|uniref:DEAD/DEAH box helicase n=1 Tax=Syntrophomonas sp. TaxID=2053627 RepID=UPI0026031D62|nr:helicase-related protein [Syntrophomonas sp.]MDD3879808.1 helicase-related protein [Syntrophomonas sp.]MDD4626914.1 helicase-related protein [Syntrophomonas sp.]